MTREEAFQCAQLLSTPSAAIDFDGAREIRNGWYFPWFFPGKPLVRSHGVIVDARTRKVVKLGAAFSLERDLRAFEAGYPLRHASLIVTAVTDERRTIEILQQLRVSKVEPKVVDGVTWQMPKPFSPLELQEKLRVLPANFGVIQVYFAVELLDSAKQGACFSFELKEVET